MEVNSNKAYLGAIEAHSMATTPKIADTVGVTGEGARDRLKRIERNGHIKSEKVGNAYVWSLPEK